MYLWEINNFDKFCNRYIHYTVNSHGNVLMRATVLTLSAPILANIVS